MGVGVISKPQSGHTAGDGCHMDGLVAGGVLRPHLEVFVLLGSVQD